MYFADVALLVTSARFASAAADFGRRHRIQMIDRELLARWMIGEQILPGIRAPRRAAPMSRPPGKKPRRKPRDDCFACACRVSAVHSGAVLACFAVVR
ncbi:restriction endonuclease [Candidatus Frankia alpina]|uniref:restriction endonuclease n=1 Tax=Candidatus Frankia alpina TaxID=2699483 RepID=UPI002E2627D3|nr:restriction endonuclease [Candidatus Frankia alpina]